MATEFGESRLAANKGAIIVNDTAAKTGKWCMIRLSADAVVSSLKNEAAAEVRGNYITNGIAAVGGQGLILTPTGPDGIFTEITLTAGSANCIND